MRKFIWGALLIGAGLIAFLVVNIAPLIVASHRQNAIVSSVRKIGGKVRYDFDLVKPSPRKGFVQTILGEDFSGRVIVVDFSHCSIADADLLPLKDLKSMTHLGLYDTRISNEALKTVGTFRQLRFLELGKTAITNEGIEYLADLQSLTGLNIQNTAITDNAMEAVAQLRNLQSLSLGMTQVSDDGLAKLRDLQLTKLFLGNTIISNRCANTLNQFRKLEHLDLFGTQLTDKVLIDTCDWPNLLVLRINNTAITDECIPALSRLETLQFAGLTETMISEEGVLRLQESLPNTKIFH